MLRNLILILALACPSALLGQATLDVDVNVISVIEAEGDILQTNGKSYLITTEDAKPQLAALINTGDSEIKWVIVRPVAGGRSTVLKDPQKGIFLFLGVKDGEYEIQTMDPQGFPVLGYFVVELDEPDDPDPIDPPPPPPPTGSFEEDLKNAVGQLSPTSQAARALVVRNIGAIRVQWNSGAYKRRTFQDSVVAMSIALNTMNQNSMTPEQYKDWGPIWLLVQQKLTEEFGKVGESLNIPDWLNKIETALK